MIRLKIITTNGQEASLAVNEIVSIDGVKYDPSTCLNPSPEDRLTEVERRITLVEAGIGFCLARTGTIDLSPETVEGSEPPATPGE